MLTILFQPLSRGSDHPLLALAQHQHQERQQDPPFAALPNFTVLLCDLVTAVTPAAPAAPKATRDHQLYVTDAAQITAALRQRIAQVQRAIPVIVAGDTCSTCGQDTVCSTCGNCHYCDDIDLPCAHLSLSYAHTRAIRQGSQEASVKSGDWFIVRPGGRGPRFGDDGQACSGATLPPLPFAPAGHVASVVFEPSFEVLASSAERW